MLKQSADNSSIVIALTKAYHSDLELAIEKPNIGFELAKHEIIYRCQGFTTEDPIWLSILEWSNEQSFEVTVSASGLCGFIDWEPLLEVKVPGKKPVLFSRITPESVLSVIEGVVNHVIVSDDVLAQRNEAMGESWPRLPRLDDLMQYSQQHRSLLAQADLAFPMDLSRHIINGGFHSLAYTLLHRTPAEVLELVRVSGLFGRGGAGFSVAKKWETAKETPSDERYIICNINEFGPHSITGKVLAESNPFGILESILLTAYATNSGKAIIFIHSAYKEAIKLLENAIHVCREVGLLGEDILGSGINLNISLIQAPGMIITGEETALISLLEGNRPVPRIKPPYPAEHGLLGKPTIIHNIETLANITGILSPIKEINEKSRTQTKLVTLAGRVKHPGLYEIPFGMTFNDIIYKLGGGLEEGHTFKAFQFGGPTGNLYSKLDLERPIDQAFVAENQVYVGTASLVVLSETDCVVDFVQFNLMILREQSCGKCVPCREGSRVLHETMQSVTRKTSSKNHEVLERFKQVIALGEVAETMRSTSFCSLGQNMPNMMLSLFKHFREELEEHVFDRKCRALVCQGLRIYVVENDRCTGCGACLPVCPVNAIAGNTIDRFFILENECIGCGNCMMACRFGAIHIK